MMSEAGPSQPIPTPSPIGQRERLAGQERAPQSDSSPRLLSDMVRDIRQARSTLPDIQSAFLPHQGVVLNFTAVEREGRNGTVSTDVGFHWKGRDGGRLSFSKPASRIERVLFGSTVNRQGLPEDARGIERAFAKAGVDSGVAVAPLLYSVVSRNPSFAEHTDYVQRAEALGVTTIGSWDAGDGQRNGAMLFAQGGRVIRVDTAEASLTQQDAIRARELIQRPDVQALFQPNERAVRLRLASSDQDGVKHTTLSYGDRTIEIADAQVPDIGPLEPAQALEALAGAETHEDKLIKPIPEDAKRGWTVISQETPSTSPSDLKTSHLEVNHPKMGVTVEYGMGPEGYDRIVIREPNGGGSVTIPYLYIDGELYVGANRVGRSATGGLVTEVPRGFSLPQESHEDTAKREFHEETGVKESLADRIHDLGGKPVNPNSTYFVANSQKREGVKLFGLEVHPDEVEIRRDSEDPRRKVYRFTPDVQGEIKEKNERIKPEGIRFFHVDLLRNTNDGFTQMAIARILTAPKPQLPQS